MTNFNAFQNDYLKSIIEPFLPGATPHITPVRFEAITPDIFAFLFRTTDKNGQQHFFVSLEYDYIHNIQEARDIITRWHGSFSEFWAPESNPKAVTDLASVSVDTDKYYKVIFAKVEPPQAPSYWSDSKVLLPNESTDSILPLFPENKQAAIKKQLEKIRHEKPAAVISIYLDNYGLEHFYYQ